MSRADFLGIMEIIDKRMNDKGKYWRHVFKSLVVLRFLVVSGSPYVVEYAIDNLFVVRTLCEFQHIDDSGYDRGQNVRDKAKELTALLSDRENIKEARKADGAGGRMDMGFGSPMGGYNNGYASSSSRIPYGGSSRVDRRAGHGRSGSMANVPNRYGDDDNEMRMAIAESRRATASKKVPRDYDEDAALKKAIEASAREAKEKEESDKRLSRSESAAIKNATTVSAAEVDLLGSFDDDHAGAASAGSGPGSNINNIGMMSASTNSFSQQQQQYQMGAGLASNNMMSSFGNNQMGSGNAGFDPFGLNTASANGNGNGNGFNAFGSGAGGMGVGVAGSNYNTNMSMPMGASTPMVSMAGNTNMFDTASAFDTSGNQLVSHKFMSTTTITDTTSGAQNPFGQTTTAPSASTNNLFGTGQTGANTMDLLGGSSSGLGSGMGGGSSNAFGNAGAFGGASGTFGSAFDGGMAAKALPFGANPNDPNSRLAEIARNSEKIDPFASLALGSASSNAGGTSNNNPFGATSSSTVGFGGSQAMGTPAASFGGGGESATPGVASMGGFGSSSLVDLSPSALAPSASFQSFGHASRNPFATGTGGTSTPQPSLNQLMSGASGVASSNAMTSSSTMFNQQQQMQQNPNAMMMGGAGNGGYAGGGMQSQPQQSMMMYQNAQHQQFQQQQQQHQQQQQINPFAQNTNTAGNNNQTDLFGL
ncbi:hypothetical protein H4S06_002859 [Coemansia sp. BCRC 34490]|nr:hypothetical protein H4S06_002859 [Coemansia sp. BCRC 34490]